MTLRTVFFLVPGLIFLGPLPAAKAQTSHAAWQSVLDAAVEQHVDTIAADREAILRVLSRSEVQAIANRAGITLRNRETAVSRLGGDELAHAAALARQAEDTLAGGATAEQWFWYFLSIAIIPLILLVVVLL